MKDMYTVYLYDSYFRKWFPLVSSTCQKRAESAMRKYTIAKVVLEKSY